MHPFGIDLAMRGHLELKHIWSVINRPNGKVSSLKIENGCRFQSDYSCQGRHARQLVEVFHGNFAPSSHCSKQCESSNLPVQFLFPLADIAHEGRFKMPCFSELPSGSAQCFPFGDFAKLFFFCLPAQPLWLFSGN